MNIRALGRRLDAWHDRTEQRIESLGWWGFPLDLVFSLATLFVVFPFIAVMSIAMHLLILALWAIPVGAVVLVAYLAGWSKHEAFVFGWPIALGLYAVFGVLQWAVGKLRNAGQQCSECGRIPLPDDDEWRVYAGEDDKLHVFCPECARREFSEERHGK